MAFDEESFRVLRENRLAFIEGVRRNRGFEEGLSGLLTRLYPDNAHFIYELLQNAEDAEATRASFRLSKDHLVFEHDGKRLFQHDNVESITSIGDSTKVDEPTKIGKFGVGFKAVFAYTKSPEIHSGDYHFRINDLVVPERIPPRPAIRDGFTTTFLFPFNHESKSAQNATLEISGALRKLDDSALLFLGNIQEVSFVLVGGARGALRRSSPREAPQTQSRGELIHVAVEAPGSEPRGSHWLRYTRSVEIDDDDDGKRKTCSVALAFGLEVVDEKANTPGRRLVPLNPGRVCIYFPAEKETSKLRFHIHAPFASTVARDSVRDTEGNKQLLAALADLAADAMEDIRDRGLLTVPALGILPIKEDNLAPFYAPFQRRLINAFQTSNLVPTKLGSHRPAGALFRGPADIVNLISDDDLSTIIKENYETPLWCANPPQRSQREDKFLDALGIDLWGWEELCDALRCDDYALAIDGDDDRPERLKRWLETKSDEWLCRLYGLLYDASERHDQTLEVADLAIVRARGAGGPRMVRPSECFFPPSEETDIPENVLLVEKATYNSAKSVNRKDVARSFLEESGVRVYDEAAEIEQIINSYKSDAEINITLHRNHMRRFVNFYGKHPHKLSIFEEKPLFLGQSPSDESDLGFRTAKSLFLDLPFEDTGLSEIEEFRRKRKLWMGYSKLGSQVKLIEFAKALGIQTKFNIRRVTTAMNLNVSSLRADYYRWRVRQTDSRIDIDWTLEGIERLVGAPTIASSRVLWTTITTAPRGVTRAEFRPNQQYKTREAPSQLVCWLRDSAWIPDAEGQFHKPQKIDRSRLAPGFDFDDGNGMLSAIGFEEEFQRQTEEYRAKDDAAKNLGFEGVGAAEDIAAALREAGLDPKQAAALLRGHARKPVQPEDGVSNPDRRRSGVRERREGAPDRQAVLRERSIQPGVKGVVAEAKAYLRAKYTNPDGEMVCQLCHQRMPFKLKSGEYYFEAVQFIRHLDKHHYANRLALCPTCAAKYQYARAENDDQVLSKIENCDVEDLNKNEFIELTLADEICELMFVKTHLFDIKLVIE